MLAFLELKNEEAKKSNITKKMNEEKKKEIKLMVSFSSLYLSCCLEYSDCLAHGK